MGVDRLAVRVLDALFNTIRDEGVAGRRLVEFHDRELRQLHIVFLVLEVAVFDPQLFKRI